LIYFFFVSAGDTRPVKAIANSRRVEDRNCVSSLSDCVLAFVIFQHRYTVQIYGSIFSLTLIIQLRANFNHVFTRQLTYSPRTVFSAFA